MSKYPQFGDVSRNLRDSINEVRGGEKGFRQDITDPGWCERNLEYWTDCLDGLIDQTNELQRRLKAIRDSLDIEERKDAA